MNQIEHNRWLPGEWQREAWYIVPPMPVPLWPMPTEVVSSPYYKVRGPYPFPKDMKKIILDLDGVLVDFVGPAFAVHGRGYPHDWTPGSYDISSMIGMSQDQFWGHEKLDATFWANLPWTAEGRDILRACERAVGAQHVCICTSPTRNPQSAAGKMAWIQSQLPAYRYRFFIGPPKYFCADPNTILVDDADKNYGEFLAHNGQAILVPRIWNSNHELRDQTLEYVQKHLLGKTAR